MSEAGRASERPSNQAATVAGRSRPCQAPARGPGGGRRIVHRGLRALAAALLAVYCLWNVFWLGQGRLPPSLFLALTGLPAPTTGGTRSVLQLCRGNWRESLRLNPLAVPLGLLFLLSLAWVAGQSLRRQRPRLPPWLAWAWAVVLGVAWAVQLAAVPREW